MINKRLFAMGNQQQVFLVVGCQLASMLLNIAMIFRLGFQLNELYEGRANPSALILTVVIFMAVIVLRGLLKKQIAHNSHLAGTAIKGQLRNLIYSKLLTLGPTYTKVVSTAEVMQISTEGVDQLETYYGKYLPQFFYAMIAPLILFCFVAPIDMRVALVLFFCVPLIPISIMAIQTIAKSILSKYWGLYASLGDHFLENLQGLTTLKIYQADDHYHKEMNKSAEHFRVITMKVLSMQLNSIIVMDVVAYGGAALGGILSILGLVNGTISVQGAIVIILLASEFFIPMRTLGSYFHIAMNGMAAADKIFKLLDTDDPEQGTQEIPHGAISVTADNLTFSYTPESQALKGINFQISTGLTALVGMSGCGKSTMASILSGKEREYGGSIKLGGIELRHINTHSLHHHMTRISDQGYMFCGTVEDNLRMAHPHATQQELISALQQVQLWDFLAEQQGLATPMAQRGSNFSGGQRQRLNLARALLRDSQLYIFDEVTSNIDVESEDAIMAVIHQLAKEKTVILISHRLANVVPANQILMIQQGSICQQGTHEDLLSTGGPYAQLFLEQQKLARSGKEGNL